MHQRINKQRGKVLTAALGLLVGLGVVTQASAAPKNALEREMEKRAARAEAAKKQSEEAAARAAAEAKAQAEQQRKAAEAAKFDPFAVSAAPAAAAAAPAASGSEDAGVARRIAAREAALQRMAQIRSGFLEILSSARARRRSPNGPPPFTPRRPSDPPGPPDNVPPGPPQHAPPGRPPGVGNGGGGGGAANAPGQS